MQSSFLLLTSTPKPKEVKHANSVCTKININFFKQKHIGILYPIHRLQSSSLFPESEGGSKGLKK